jgi:hypothetical protein
MPLKCEHEPSRKNVVVTSRSSILSEQLSQDGSIFTSHHRISR